MHHAQGKFLGVKPIPYPKRAEPSDAQNFHTQNLHAPTTVAKATKFGTVSHYDQAKNFRYRTHPRGWGTHKTQYDTNLIPTQKLLNSHKICHDDLTGTNHELHVVLHSIHP